MFQGEVSAHTAEQLANLTVEGAVIRRPTHLYVRNARFLSVAADSRPVISYSVAFPVVLALLGGLFILLYLWYRKHQKLLSSKRRIAREVGRQFTSMPNQESLSRRKQKYLEALQVVKRMLEECPSSKVLESELQNTLTRLYHVEKLLSEAMENASVQEASRNASAPVRYTVDLNLQSFSASRHPSSVGSITERSNMTASSASTSGISSLKARSNSLHTMGALASYQIVDGRVVSGKTPDEDGSHPLASAAQIARIASLQLAVMRGNEKRKNEHDAEWQHLVKKAKGAGAESGFQSPASRSKTVSIQSGFQSPAPRSKSVSIQADEDVIAQHTASARSSLASDDGILGLAFASLLPGNYAVRLATLAADQTSESGEQQTADPGAQGRLATEDPSIVANLHEGTSYFDNDEADPRERRLASAEQNSLASEEVLDDGSSHVTGADSNSGWSSKDRWSPLTVVIDEQGSTSTAFAKAEEKRLLDLTHREVQSTRIGSCLRNFRKVCNLCGESSMGSTTVEQVSGPGSGSESGPVSGSGSPEASPGVVTIQNPLFVPSTGDLEVVGEAPSVANRTLPFGAAVEQLLSRGKQLLFATKTDPAVISQERISQSWTHVKVDDSQLHQSTKPYISSVVHSALCEEGGSVQLDAVSPDRGDDCTCEKYMGLQQVDINSGEEEVRGICCRCGKPRVAEGQEFCGCPKKAEEVQQLQAAGGFKVPEHIDCSTQTSLWGAWGFSPCDMYLPPDNLHVQPVSLAPKGRGDTVPKTPNHQLLSGETVNKIPHGRSHPSAEQQSLPRGTSKRKQQHHAEAASPVQQGPHLSQGQKEWLGASAVGSSASVVHSPGAPTKGSSASVVHSPGALTKSKSSSPILGAYTVLAPASSDDDDCFSSNNSDHTAHLNQKTTIHDQMEDITTSGHPEGISLMDYADFGEKLEIFSGAVDSSADSVSPKEGPTVVCPDHGEEETASGHLEGTSLKDYECLAQEVKTSDSDSSSEFPRHELLSAADGEGKGFMHWLKSPVVESCEVTSSRGKAPSEHQETGSVTGDLVNRGSSADEVLWVGESCASSEDREVLGARPGSAERMTIAETRSSSCQTTETTDFLSYFFDEERESQSCAGPALDTAGTTFLAPASADVADVCQQETYNDFPTSDDDACENSTSDSQLKYLDLTRFCQPPDDDGEEPSSPVPRLTFSSEDATCTEEVLLEHRLVSGRGGFSLSKSPEERVSCDDGPPPSNIADAAEVVLDTVEGELLELGATSCYEEPIANEEDSSSAYLSGEASNDFPQAEKLHILELEDGSSTVPVKTILAESSANVPERVVQGGRNSIVLHGSKCVDFNQFHCPSDGQPLSPQGDTRSADGSGHELDHELPLTASKSLHRTLQSEEAEEKVAADVQIIGGGASDLPDACATSGGPRMAITDLEIVDERITVEYEKSVGSNLKFAGYALLPGAGDWTRVKQVEECVEVAEKSDRHASFKISSPVVDLRHAYRKRPQGRRRLAPPGVVHIRRSSYTGTSKSRPKRSSCSMEPHSVDVCEVDEDTVHLSSTTEDQVKESVECSGDGLTLEIPVVDLREVCDRRKTYRNLRTNVLDRIAKVRLNCTPVHRIRDTQSTVKKGTRDHLGRGKLWYGEKQGSGSCQGNTISSDIVEKHKSSFTSLDCDNPPTVPKRGCTRLSRSSVSSLELRSLLKDGIQLKKMPARKPWKYERKLDSLSSKLMLRLKHTSARSEALRQVEEDILQELQRSPFRCSLTLSRVESIKLSREGNTGVQRPRKRVTSISSKPGLPRKTIWRQKCSYGNVKL